MITLSEPARQAIERHAEETYPHECVGLLIGRLDGEQKSVEEIFAAQNTWNVPVSMRQLAGFNREISVEMASRTATGRLLVGGAARSSIAERARFVTDP